MPDDARSHHNFRVQLDELDRTATVHLPHLRTHLGTVRIRLDDRGRLGRGVATALADTHDDLVAALVQRLYEAEIVTEGTATALSSVADLYRRADGEA